MARRHFDVIVEPQVMIPMRDGLRLAADVYFPAEGSQRLTQPLPVILERTPYDRTSAIRAQRFYFFARRGYAGVLQDVRGRYESEGEHDPFGAADVADGYDTCEWIGRQPWCNGRIASTGTSYTAMNQASLAMSGPPHLAVQFIRQGFSNHHNGRLRQGGVLRLTMVAWAFHQAAQSHAALRDPGLRAVLEEASARVQEWIARMPLRPGLSPLRHLPDYERFVMNISTRGELDEWWMQPGRYIENSWDRYPDIPVYLVGSWYDSHAHVTSWAYQELRRRMKSPVKLIFGPWTHGAQTSDVPTAGEAYFGPESTVEGDELQVAWFDQVLRGIDTGILDEPPVRIFVMGSGSGRWVRSQPHGTVDVGGRWRYEQEWPLARTRYAPYYFHGDGILSPAPPSAERESTGYRFNPLDPVPTVGGPISSMFGLKMEPGAYDQRARAALGHRDGMPLSSRSDVVVFQTPPLNEGIEVTGPIEAVLYVSSSAPDTDFSVKLVDVHPPNPDFPDGVALNVTDGIMRARYRNSWTRPEFLRPGEVVELRVQLPPTSLFFAPGHRIRVDISSSNWPRFEVNPNTGEPIGQHRRVEIATNTIHHSRDYPSHIVLPVIPGT
ncbi:MAG: CocE/NonD family hydrolase [Armatimonadetes bacterium]|nr:CocE/NonD family hydrolase [Armatimonadota bacterium]